MRKAELASKIEGISIILLFFSVLVLMLNSFLPIVILKNVDNPDKLVYFNIESMQYSENIDIQNLYNDINLINIFIWIIIICIFIAFFGVILTISEIYKKISYLFLTVGCLSIIFSSIICYLYVTFILKVLTFDNILLAYIVVEPLRYSHIIFIILIVIILISILYVYLTITFLFKVFKDDKLKKQELTTEKLITKSFSKPVEQLNIFKNNKENINQDFYFNKKNEFTENRLSNEMNNIKINEDLDTICIKKETMDEQITTNKNVECLDEKKSPFLKKYEKEKPKQKKDETDEVKLSGSLEKALSSAIDKMKKRRS